MSKPVVTTFLSEKKPEPLKYKIEHAEKPPPTAEASCQVIDLVVMSIPTEKLVGSMQTTFVSRTVFVRISDGSTFSQKHG